MAPPGAVSGLSPRVRRRPFGGKLTLGLIYVESSSEPAESGLAPRKTVPPARLAGAPPAAPAPPRQAPKGPSRLLSGHMATRDPLAEQAVVLVSTLDGGGEALEAAVQKLAETSDRPALELAQRDLVGRIQQRSDDFQATAALNLVNRALATVGWTNPYSWKHRRKP